VKLKEQPVALAFVDQASMIVDSVEGNMSSTLDATKFWKE
jgi:hypothetical protein